MCNVDIIKEYYRKNRNKKKVINNFYIKILNYFNDVNRRYIKFIY